MIIIILSIQSTFLNTLFYLAVTENTVIFMNLKVRCVVAIDSQGTAVEEQEINQECKKIGLEYICKKANELLKLYGLEDISIPSSIE